MHSQTKWSFSKGYVRSSKVYTRTFLRARQTRRRGCFKSHNLMLDLEVKLIPYGSWLSPTTSSGALRLNRNRVTLHLSEERPASRIRGCRCSLALDVVPRDQCGKLSYRSARLGASGQWEGFGGQGLRRNIDGEMCPTVATLRHVSRCQSLDLKPRLSDRMWIGSSVDVHVASYRSHLTAASWRPRCPQIWRSDQVR